MQPLINFFSQILHCLGRTKEQKLFEERLYQEGLKKELTKVIQTINTETIKSKDIALKFILQELDVLRKGDALNQKFADRSGFHLAEYLGTSQKFEEDRAEIQRVQDVLINFLDQIRDEKIMFQSAEKILNGVMEYWEIGKYSEEGKIFIKDVEPEEKPSTSKKIDTSSFFLYLKNIKNNIMDKLVYADEQIQKGLNIFASTPIEIKQEEPTVKKEEPDIEKVEPIKIYSDEKIYELMEEYSLVIEEIIIGKITPENHEKVAEFQQHISSALKEENNLASVFYPFFDSKSFSPTIDFSISKMDDKSKKFFIDILKSFNKRGFSVNLYRYLDTNREIVYALASQGDTFMQYLIEFWYEKSNETSIQ